MNYNRILAAQNIMERAQERMDDFYREQIRLEAEHFKGLEPEFAKTFRATFRKMNGERQVGRTWGQSSFRDAKIVPKDTGILLELEYEDYCRGCYMGTATDEMFIPREFIDDPEGGQKFFEQRVRAIEEKIAKDAEEAQEASERARLKAEAEARATYERLKEQFE
jgi:hypothetical protein